jgi:hypothetical protein
MHTHSSHLSVYVLAQVLDVALLRLRPSLRAHSKSGSTGCAFIKGDINYVG